MTRRATTIFVSALAVVSVASPIARAQTAHVPIAAEGCPPELAASVEPALEVELSSIGPDARRELETGTMRPALACGDGSVTAAIVRDGQRVEQRIDANDAALARRLAMALAELAEASAETVGPSEAPADASAEPDEDHEETREPEASEPRSRLRAAGGVWMGGAPWLVLGALDLGVELMLVDHVALVVGAAGAIGRVTVPSAAIDVRLVSAAASLRFGAGVGPFWLGGGPAIRGGAVLWTGTPADPAHARGGDLAGGWLGLGAVLAALVAIPSSPVRIGVEIEGGGIAVYSAAIVLDSVAARVDLGWLEARVVVDVAIDGTNS